MPKRNDIKSILIIGAGPIIIGQACEFDYSGAQACKALKEEGIRVILINSNPATIMTDPMMADSTYIEPIEKNIIENNINNVQAINKGFSAPQTIYKESFLTDPSMPDESIDCLSLNIASKDVSANMPVMIWIHGGAYITGSSNSVVYDLDYLPLHEIVLVTINYRLGPFGFLKLDDATNGQIKSTGNEGLMDQKLAIDWVKENISEFGGNPENITLFGESAGAWSVALQSSISPHGNLFSKAICQSGGMNAYFDQERANQWGELFLKTTNDSGLKIKDLLSVDHKQITSLASKMKHTMIAHGKWLSPEVGFAPIADGNFLPLNPIKNFQDSPIKLIVGTTADEYRLWSEFEPYYLNLNKDSLSLNNDKLILCNEDSRLNRYSPSMNKANSSLTQVNQL